MVDNIVIYNKLSSDAMGLLDEARMYINNELTLDAISQPISSDMVIIRESMSLTTRLSFAVSWLIAYEGALEGEILFSDLCSSKYELSTNEICMNRYNGKPSALPPKLRDFISRSHSLYERIIRVERMICCKKVMS